MAESTCIITTYNVLIVTSKTPKLTQSRSFLHSLRCSWAELNLFSIQELNSNCMICCFANSFKMYISLSIYIDIYVDIYTNIYLIRDGSLVGDDWKLTMLDACLMVRGSWLKCHGWRRLGLAAAWLSWQHASAVCNVTSTSEHL